jgi:hypothetical protein
MSSGATSYDPTALGPQEEQDTPGTLRDDDGNLLPSFDPKYADPFTGLLYLGALADEFSWLGHDFKIRTLRDGELLAISQIIKPYQDTMGLDRAYANAVVGMCLMSLDGEELPIPIGETKRINEWGHLRFEYIRDNWYSSTVDQVFNRYLQLDDLVKKVVEAMGKASAPEAQIPSSNGI